MFSFNITKKPNFMNHSVNEYCRNSLQLSIQKITQQVNEERNKKYENPITKCEISPNHSNNVYPFLFFLYISTLTYCFYKRVC